MEHKNNVVINLSNADKAPTYPKMTVSKSGWVTFGAKNLFPQEIIALNSKSPVNKSIIESTVTYICGKGVRDSQPGVKNYVGAPSAGESWDDIIEKFSRDYKTFGGFYGQVILNKDSTTVTVYHQDFSKARIGKITDKGAIETFMIASDWTKTSGKGKPIEVDIWPGIDKAKRGKPYFFYHYDYEPGLDLYCIPNYYSAVEYIKADGTLGEFYNNSISNGFTPSVVISMPSNPDAPKKEAFQNEMEDAFSGSKGASSIVVLWGENTTVKPEITPFNASANADIYNNVEGIVFQKIISAHRLSSPTLAGVSGSGNLSGNAAEIIDAYVLYNYTVIEKMRRKILDKLNVFTKINGLGTLAIDELDVLPKIRETDTPVSDAVPEDTPATLTRKDNPFIKALKSLLWKQS